MLRNRTSQSASSDGRLCPLLLGIRVVAGIVDEASHLGLAPVDDVRMQSACCRLAAPDRLAVGPWATMRSAPR